MPGPLIVATLLRAHGDTGVQTHVATFAAFAGAQGRAVEVLTPFAAPRALLLPVFGLRRLIDPVSGPASVWWYRHWHAVFLERVLRQRLADGAPCTVYAQCPLSAAAALRARRSPAQRVVAVVHFNGSQADEWAGKGRIAAEGGLARRIRAFEATTLPRVDGLVFVSAFMHRELAARIPALRGVPHAVVPNFVPPPAAAPAGDDGDLLCIGTLEPRKNQRHALAIVAAARDQGQRLRLTLAGDGPDRAALEAQARALGIADRVRFAGFVREAATLFASHRAGLHVATLENLPLALVEALAWGRPVFAAPVGGVPEVFDDGVEGRTIPLDDAPAAARAIVEWLNAPERLREAGAKARERFEACFSTEAAGRRLLAFLDG